jgi:hypothetical protein
LTSAAAEADDRWVLTNISLTRVGAFCAVIGVACFVLAIIFMATSGVQVLIPETGQNGLDWIHDVDQASGLFFAGAWLIIFGGVFLLVALIGFYPALREAGPIMILAPVLGIVGMTLVTISHLIPIAMAYEVVPGYVDATGATRASIEVTADALAATSRITNYIGDALLWGVVVPLYALAILKTTVVRRWIGWVGMVSAVFAGWLGLLSPASSVIDGITFIGFVTFFVFMASLGVSLLRRTPRGPEEPAPASIH